MNAYLVVSYNSSVEIINGGFLLLQEQPLLISRLGDVWSGYITSTVRL